MIIDAHHHFWRYDEEEFGWISEEMKAIRRDFLPEDLKVTIGQSGIDGVVSVQARQKTEETRWLLELADEHDFIKGVTGWLPLYDPEVEKYLEEYGSRGKLKALRHVVQDEADDDFILRPDFNRGVGLLKDKDLIYEILIFEKHLPQTIRFVDRHPGQIFVLDHIAKPKIRENILSPWRENIMELAKRDNVFCKLSGMVTEADLRNWTYEQLVPYFEVVLEAFGAERLMFGSDWPVCLTAIQYDEWLQVVKRFIAGLSLSEQAGILGDNAVKIYKLNK
jgi:L-fuconolactonase